MGRQGCNSAVGTDKVQFVGVRNTHIESVHMEKVVAAIGVHNLVIIDTPDALLVADRAQSQDKIVAEALKVMRTPAYELPSPYPPWGTYATLRREDGYQVKRITVEPGQKLSLQFHCSAEHWV